MNKKGYIAPAVDIYEIHMSEGILISGSDGNGGGLFGSNDKGTSDGSYEGQDTKDQGDYDVWDE